MPRLANNLIVERSICRNILSPSHSTGIQYGIGRVTYFYPGSGPTLSPDFTPTTEASTHIRFCHLRKDYFVLLQELTPSVAAAIRRELAGEFPYQIVDPGVGAEGLGVIARYPLRPTGQRLPGTWVGTPQVLELDVSGTTVTLVNFHASSTVLAGPALLEGQVRERERQAQTIVAFVAAHPGPLIAAGDLNATDQSTAYAWITRVLRDAWREAGWGLGHTFPGAASPGSSRPTLAGILVPMWLVRIDYVFHSPHWQAVWARLGPWDGRSDHRPVVAQLILIKD